MKITKKVIHQIAGCWTCDKQWQDFKTARKKAYSHAKSTGHYVWVELGTGITYNKP